ncbi:MAG: beta-galactosidase [Armatimonadetes bacterium]|nr:beta-galactosidase [Armatimonadota bacterium]
MAPDGSVRRIIYGNRSSAEWQELERPLRFDPLHSTVTGTPSSSAPGQYDWSGHLQEWENIKKQGAAEKSCLLLFMALHDNCYTPKWLADRFAADPELRHVLQPPGELADRSGRQQLNWWHPAIRDYARELVSHMGRTFRDRDDFLFYLFQWESYGPNVSAATGTREVGYGRYAEQDFRRWLAARYGDIGRLNARWRSNHASFDAIAPPPDRYVTERRRTDPLTAEWEAWREDSYYDWCKLIYQAWKEADPNKPVMSGHNMLLRPFNGARLYETCDTVSWHSGGGDFMPGTAYVHSLSRYNGHRPLAQYENFWGIQEDHDRMSEELPKRHAAVKYLFRLTAWDRFLQVWWYSYTSAPYLTVYDGNYFDPSYALTTLRYRSAALPVYFDKFRRLQRTLLDSKVVPSRICLLAPSASNRNNWPYDASQKEGRDLFWALFERNHLVEYLPEEYLLDGRARLSDFDAVILPYALYLAEPLQEQLAAWLRGGGRLLLAAGPAGLYDELGLDSGKILREVFGNPTLTAMEAPTGRWQWRAEPAGGDGIVRARVGTSEAILLTEPAADLKSRGALPGLLAAIEQAAPRPVRDRRDQLELVFREAGATRYLLALNPSLDEPAETVVEVRGRYAQATDLDYPEGISVPVRCEDEWTRFPLSLAPGEATILRLEP